MTTSTSLEPIAAVVVWNEPELGLTCTIDVGIDECDVVLDMPSASMFQTTTSRPAALALAAAWHDQFVPLHSVAA